MAAGHPASPTGRREGVGAGGSSLPRDPSIPVKSAHAHFLPSRRLSTARRWAEAGAARLLGTAERPSNPPKMRTRGAERPHSPQLAEVWASNLSVNRCQGNQAQKNQIYGSSSKRESHVKFKRFLLRGALPDT